MKIALIADAFPPLRSSGAVQLRDLSREFARQGHALTVLLPSPGQKVSWLLERMDGVQVLRLKAPRIKDINYFLRTIAEFVMPFAMLRQFKKSPLHDEQWDGLVWYSPSIFHGPLVSAIKKKSACKSYLIIRDIFPEWAVDIGLMRRGLPYKFFSGIARYQYSVADVIGIQSPGNRVYFNRWRRRAGRTLEVLHNWLDKPMEVRCTIRVNETQLANCKVFVYAGNMGVAQGMDILLDLAERFRSRSDIGFLFVGRGSELVRLKKIAKDKNLDKVLFYDEIHPDEIPDLYSQCAVGIVSLDSRHKSHNIPGKFLTYMQSGLPVLASVNEGNDLSQLIRNENIGQVCESHHIEDLVRFAIKLLKQIEEDDQLSKRCRNLFYKKFNVEKTVSQIISALSASTK